MKTVLLRSISIYQQVFSPLLKHLLGVSRFCPFTPSCSGYAYVAIEKYGVFYGGWLAIKRLVSCQPFGNQYDRVI